MEGRNPMKGLLVIFEEVRDPRRENARHDLTSILFIAVAATLCGEKTCVGFAEFAEAHFEVMREIVDLPHGPPSHDTFSRVFRVLDPGELVIVLGRFVSAMRAALGLRDPRTVAIDGKSLNGAYEKGKAYAPALMVNVWDNETRIAIAAVRAPDRDEPSGALEALKTVVLKGATITGDALYCRPDMIKACRDRKAHYAFKLKANNPTLFKNVEKAFRKSGKTLSVFETTDRKHGRTETRRASVLDAHHLAGEDWPGLASVIRVETRRTGTDGKATARTRYMISDRRFTPQKALEIFRQHWSIENRLHWKLDVIFEEDSARSRKDYAPENLAVIRRIAHNILSAHPSDKSIRHKMKLASWSKDFFFELFTHMR
jgi:predicted transposase YbfD/YdcC